MATTDPRTSEILTRRWIAIQRAGTHAGQELSAETKEALLQAIRLATDPSLSQRQKLSQIKQLLEESKQATYIVLVSALTDAADATLNSAYEEAKSIGAKKKPDAPTKQDVNRWMTSVPMESSGITVAGLYDATYDSARRAVVGAVLLGAAEEVTSTVTRSRLKAISDKLERDMITVGQTAVNHTAIQTKQHVINKSGVKRVADRVMWVSTLDHRTSPYCQAADGKVFPIDSGPRPPAHPRCRSNVVLVAKGENVGELRDDLSPRPAVVPKSDAQLEDKGLTTKGGKVRKPSRTDRSPLKGVQTSKQTYESWMRSQSTLYQDKVLGKNAAKRLRNGEKLSTVLSDTNSSIDFSSLKEALN